MSLLYTNESPYSMTLCVNDTHTDCTLCTWHNNLSSTSIFGTIVVSEDPRIETLRRYSYGIALPAICFLGIIGNIFNLIVLTRRNMRGTAYIYMRGKFFFLVFNNYNTTSHLSSSGSHNLKSHRI